MILFKWGERLDTQRKSNQNSIEKFEPIATNKHIDHIYVISIIFLIILRDNKCKRVLGCTIKKNHVSFIGVIFRYDCELQEYGLG